MPDSASGRLRWALYVIVLLCASIRGTALGMVDIPQAESSNRNEQLTYLDARKPTLVQAIESSDRVETNPQFVQVDVVEVQNPKHHTATFKVEYQSKDNERVVLGSFSLYPSDNPGKFIVPTQRKVASRGAIVLSLIVPDNFKTGDILRVGVKRIKFVNSEK